MCNLSDFSHLSIGAPWAEILRTELDLWHRTYLPVGETVLDIGAGCGETAQFYLNHGAKRVICVEGDPQALKLLHQNFDRDNRILIVEARVDSVKCDIEGSEENMIIETHFPAYLERLFAFRGLHAQTSIWKLKKMKNIHSVMNMTNNLLARLHYARIQTAHFIRRVISSI